MPAPLRVIIEETPASGAVNMAVDEVLLESALADGRPTLRWYQWEEPTLSLGHFQADDDSTIDARFSGLPRVRRLSGGGAILHDREWTYSIALGPQHPLSEAPRQLYLQVHQTVVEVLQRFQISASLRGQADRALDHHFLCFSRGDANDVVVGQNKVLGSAQRRRHGGVLQHGALLIKASEHAPEFPGVFDFGPIEEKNGGLFDNLTQRVADELDNSWQAGQLNDSELHRSRMLASEKYSDASAGSIPIPD
ncbi:MAG: hypothetical protein KDA93_17520 [Planctomycetaceae bacterium]|nr:hypothetical protein [Planctomycetaceae bacterium]